MIEKSRTIQQIRDAYRQQQKLGVYTPTERELAPGTWVWQTIYVRSRKDYFTVLGIVTDIRKYRSGSVMVRDYTVVNTMGQTTGSREDLLIADFNDVRIAEGLTLENELKACINEALIYGASTANTDRWKVAAEEALNRGQRSIVCDHGRFLREYPLWVLPYPILYGKVI